MNLTVFFAVISACLTVYASFLYFMSLIDGINESKPNAISWAIWFVADALNIYTYFSLVKGDMTEMVYLIICAIETLLVLSVLIYKRSASKPELYEIMMFLLIIAIIPFQILTSQTRISNVILQVIYIVGFIPLIRGVKKGINIEKNSLAWSLAAMGGLFSMASIFTNFHGDYLAYASPLINFTGDAIIYFLIIGHMASKPKLLQPRKKRT